VNLVGCSFGVTQRPIITWSENAMIYFLQYDFGLAINVGVFFAKQNIEHLPSGTLFNMQTLSP